MSYANKKLTAALQKIAEKEKSKPHEVANFSASRPSDKLSFKAHSGVSRFLKERAAFRQSTQNLSVGSY